MPTASFIISIFLEALNFEPYYYIAVTFIIYEKNSYCYYYTTDTFCSLH